MKKALIAAAATILAAAAAAYITNYMNQHQIETLKNQRLQVTSPQGTYLWQVAVAGQGQRWTGYIQVDEHGAAKIQMWRWDYCPPKNDLQRLRLLQQEP